MFIVDAAIKLKNARNEETNCPNTTVQCICKQTLNKLYP